jgi:hypothetical protein
VSIRFGTYGTASILLAVALLIALAATAAAPRAAGAGEGPRPMGPSPLATDDEPANDDTSGATTVRGGDTVNGSIMVTAPEDHGDWYKCHASSSSALNVTLYLYDYDPYYPAAYDLQLGVGYYYDGRFFWSELATTGARYEQVSAAAYSPMEFYILVFANMSADGTTPYTLPASYRLDLAVKGATPYVRDSVVWDYLDREGGVKSADWYVVSPSPDHDEWLEVYVWAPATGDYDVFVYNGWFYDRDRLQAVNISAQRTTGNAEYLTFTGAEGPFYIKVMSRTGYGWYAVYVHTAGTTTGATNNRWDGAKEVSDNEPIHGELDQSTDHYDWFKFKVRAGEDIPKIRFELDQGTWNIYNISIYDEGKNYVTGVYTTPTGGVPAPNNLPTIGANVQGLKPAYDGYYWLVLRADIEAAAFFYPLYFVPIRCDYWLTFTLPNRPPRVSGVLPPVLIDEDTTFTGLVLFDYFSDPDGDALDFSLGRPTQHLTVTFNETRGNITIVPDRDWHGIEKVYVRATDDGPGRKFVESYLMVTVYAVNDPPLLISDRTIGSIVMYEGEAARTTAMGTLFTDADDDAYHPLVYSLALVSEDMHPAGAHMPVPVYEKATDAFVVGPVRLMYGHATFRVRADDKNGTPPELLPSVEFDVTVLHRNHPPALARGVSDPFRMTLHEGEYNDSLSAWDLFEDVDTAYAGDALRFSLSAPISLSVGIDADGRLWFDARRQYYPGQNYQEDLVLKTADSSGSGLALNLTVTVIPFDDPPEVTSTSPMAGTDVTVLEGERMEFKVVVRDADTPHALVNYSWSLDGIVLQGENRSLHSYVTDFDTSDGRVHVLGSIVRSGLHTLEATWNITVRNVDRPPLYVILLNPLNSSRYKVGDSVTFTGAAVDPDGDAMAFKWYDGNRSLGDGRELTRSDLFPGIHMVRLMVSDGTYSINASVVFEVTRPIQVGKQAPGLGGPALAVAMAVAASAAAVTRGRAQRRRSP